MSTWECKCGSCIFYEIETGFHGKCKRFPPVMTGYKWEQPTVYTRIVWGMEKQI